MDLAGKGDYECASVAPIMGLHTEAENLESCEPHL